jgi:BlaI family penicillinase repressor
MRTPRPTDGELAILRVLWDRGPSTVRQVHDVLSRERPTAYTTALKLLQIMTEKGLVRRDEADRTHVYHSRLSEEQTQRQLVRDLVDRAFGGSSSKLVMQALATKRASAEELTEIRQLLNSRKFQDAKPGTPAAPETAGGNSGTAGGNSGTAGGNNDDRD